MAEPNEFGNTFFSSPKPTAATPSAPSSFDPFASAIPTEKIVAPVVPGATPPATTTPAPATAPATFTQEELDAKLAEAAQAGNQGELALMRAEMANMKAGFAQNNARAGAQAELDTLLNQYTAAIEFGEEDQAAEIKGKLQEAQSKLASTPAAGVTGRWQDGINDVVNTWKQSTPWYGMDVAKTRAVADISTLIDPNKFATADQYTAAINAAVDQEVTGVTMTPAKTPTPSSSSPGSAPVPKQTLGEFKAAEKVSEIPAAELAPLREVQRVAGISDADILANYNDVKRGVHERKAS